MKVIGIVGGIASGKSTVAKLLRNLGAGHIDADKIGHEVLVIPEIIQQMTTRWCIAEKIKSNRQIWDGGSRVDSLNRSLIANIVFNDKEELEFLNAITHSLIEGRIKEKLSLFHPDYTKAVVLDAPLLLEAGWNSLCDMVLFVDSSLNYRAERADHHSRSCQMDRYELTRRESFQFDLDMKRQFSTHVIDNNVDSIAALKGKVSRFWEENVNGSHRS